MLNFKLRKPEEKKEYKDITVHLEKFDDGDIVVYVDNDELGPVALCYFTTAGKLLRADSDEIGAMGFDVNSDGEIKIGR